MRAIIRAADYYWPLRAIDRVAFISFKENLFVPLFGFRVGT